MIEAQNKAILRYLQKGKTLTGLQALRLFGCARLAARIYDIKHMGHKINKEMIKSRGKRIARYSLGGK
jgi:hypothetical protein